MLYYSGLRVDNFNALINLIENSICHVIDTAYVNTPELHVNFRPVEWSTTDYKIAFLPDTTIKEAILNDLVPRFQVSA